MFIMGIGRCINRLQRNVLHSWTLIIQKPLRSYYLVLRVSRQTGRYLSNSIIRLAFSDWTSLLSIQLDTGGFQPKSAGLIYRMPVKVTRNIYINESTVQKLTKTN